MEERQKDGWKPNILRRTVPIGGGTNPAQPNTHFIKIGNQFYRVLNSSTVQPEQPAFTVRSVAGSSQSNSTSASPAIRFSAPSAPSLVVRKPTGLNQPRNTTTPVPCQLSLRSPAVPQTTVTSNCFISAQQSAASYSQRPLVTSAAGSSQSSSSSATSAIRCSAPSAPPLVIVKTPTGLIQPKNTTLSAPQTSSTSSNVKSFSSSVPPTTLAVHVPHVPICYSNSPPAVSTPSYTPVEPDVFKDLDLEGSRVKVSGLPNGTTEDLLLNLVNQKIMELGFSTQEEAYRCTFMNDGSAVLQFVSVEEAKFCCALDGLMFSGASLRFEIENSNAPAEKSNLGSSPPSSSSSSPKASSVSCVLNSDSSVIFVKALLNNRYMRGQQICVDYQKVWQELMLKGISMSMYQIKQRKRSLLVYYHSIQGTPQEINWKHSAEIKAFLGGAVTLPRWDDEGWTTEETLTLIDEYVERKNIFDCPTVRHDTTWAEIVRALRVQYPARSQKFTHASVLSKWDRLRNFYNKIEDNLNQTGESSNHKAWPFYDAMSLHLHKSVTTNPEFTLSAGVQHTVHRRSRDNEEQSPAKKPRLSIALRKMELETRRLEAQENMAQAFLKIAEKLDRRH